MLDHVDNDPANGSRGCGRVGVEGSVHGTDGAVESRTTVESEPAEPDEARAEEDKGSVVRLVVHWVLTLLGAFTEDNGVCKSCPTGSNVDGTATGIIERRKVI